MPAADEHVCLAGHRGVDGVLCETQAVHVVLRGSRHATDEITRVDVLEIERNPPLLEERRDLVFQMQSDVAQLAVAGGVRGERVEVQEILPNPSYP